jgi:hypothetical protein
VRKRSPRIAGAIVGADRADNDKPLVSVVVPCFDAAPWVGEAIDSVLRQSYPSVEIIVVDDGSSDGTLDIVKSYGNRLRFETGPNRGGAAARNRGLSLARGYLVLFLDADDVLLPDMIGRMVDKAIAHPGYAPLCDREDFFDSAPVHSVPHRNRYDGRDSLIFFLETSPQTSAVLHRRAELEAVGGFDESLPCCQERDLHLRLALRGLKLVAVPEILFRLRRRGGSVSSGYLRVLRQRVEIHERLGETLVREGQATPGRTAALARALSSDGRQLVRHGETTLAERAFSAAARYARGGDRSAFHGPASRAVATLLGPLRGELLIQRVTGALQRSGSPAAPLAHPEGNVR